MVKKFLPADPRPDEPLVVLTPHGIQLNETNNERFADNLLPSEAELDLQSASSAYADRWWPKRRLLSWIAYRDECRINEDLRGLLYPTMIRVEDCDPVGTLLRALQNDDLPAERSTDGKKIHPDYWKHKKSWQLRSEENLWFEKAVILKIWPNPNDATPIADKFVVLGRTNARTISIPEPPTATRALEVVDAVAEDNESERSSGQATRIERAIEIARNMGPNIDKRRQKEKEYPFRDALVAAFGSALTSIEVEQAWQAYRYKKRGKRRRIPSI